MLSIAFANENNLTTSALSGNSLASLFPFVIIFVIFYFMLIRPQMKKQKSHSLMLESLKKGDQIITSGGIIATILKLEQDNFIVEIAPEVKIKILKTAVAELINNKVESSNKSS